MKKLIVLVIVAVLVTLVNNDNEYIEIPSSSIRMRVIANSNSENDQKNKIIVKSILEEKLYNLISGVDNLDDINSLIIKNKDNIDDSIRDEIESKDIDIEFTSNYGLNYFPEKTYKGVKYGAGNYNSYVLTLGEGNGENWWCVLYPPLCLLDDSNEYEYHYLIKDMLNKYN